jgi:hypothetical protein
VNHAPLDSLEKLGLRYRIRKVSPNAAVNIGWCAYLVLVAKEDEKVHMGQAPLLKLDCVYVSHYGAYIG